MMVSQHLFLNITHQEVMEQYSTSNGCPSPFQMLTIMLRNIGSIVVCRELEEMFLYVCLKELFWKQKEGMLATIPCIITLKIILHTQLDCP